MRDQGASPTGISVAFPSPIVDSALGDLLERQLMAIIAVHPVDVDVAGFATRSAGYAQKGLADLEELRARSALSLAEVEKWAACAVSDQRFEFLFAAPYAASVGSALSRALCLLLWGKPNHEAELLGALLGVFNVVLDGLMDEVPEVFESEGLLLEYLVGGQWREPPLSDDELAGRHPAVRLVYAIASEATQILQQGAAWDDPSLRRPLLRAINGAVTAQADSARIQEMSWPLDERSAEACLAAKSEHALLVQGLAPVCLGGWPPDIDRDVYQTALVRLGRTGGWLDDMRDLVLDAGALRWNRALLELFAALGRPRGRSPQELALVLISAIGDDHVTDALVHRGAVEYADFLEGLFAMEGRSEDVLQLVADVARLSLTL